MNRYIALQKIIELGGFTKAASTLGYTQPSISQMIASLENELGMKLYLSVSVDVEQGGQSKGAGNGHYPRRRNYRYFITFYGNKIASI